MTTTTATLDPARASTADLIERLDAIRDAAGDAYGPGFVDAEAAAIIEALQSRDTDEARAALVEHGWAEEESEAEGDVLTEEMAATCTTCGLVRRRQVVMTEDESHEATDPCPRCGRTGVRAEADPDEQIAALRSESGEAGDLEQVAICDRALEGDAGAIAECARVIRDAEAQR